MLRAVFRAGLTALPWAALLPALALAQSSEPATYGAAAHTQRPTPARNPEDPTAAGTALALQDRPLALETLGEALREAPSTQVTEVGAYGTFSGVSLRGNELGHTTWVLGEIPLNGPDSGALDLSTLPLPLFDSLEVYRGGSPLWFSQGAIGGVVRLMPRSAATRKLQASLGLGSFGRRELRASGEVVREGKRPVAFFSGVNLLHSDGDFPYRDDNGTWAVSSDDRDRRIRNAQVTDASGIAHAQIGLLGGRLDTVFLGFERTGGIPGAGGERVNAGYARRSFGRALFALSYVRERTRRDGSRRYRVQAMGSARADKNRVSDPFSEVAAGSDPVFFEDTWWRGFARLAASHAPLRLIELTALTTYARDRFTARTLPLDVESRALRDTVAVGGEVALRKRWGARALELRPSVLTTWSRAHIPDVEISRPVVRESRVRGNTYRVAGAFSLLAGLSLRAGFASGARLPSVLELFGDRGFVQGNRALEPERSRSFDAGVVLSQAFSSVCVALELNGFYARVDDLIRFVRTGQNDVIAKNLTRTWQRGAELGVDVGVDRYVALKGHARLLDTRDEFGNQSPFAARWIVHARPEVYVPIGTRSVQRLVLFTTLDHTGQRFQDTANLQPVPVRTRLGVGFALPLFDQRLELMGRMTDVLDARGSDTLGFPLPGRSVLFSLALREDMS